MKTRNDDPRPVNRLLAHAETLHLMQHKIQGIKEANTILKQVLPADLLDKCTIINLKDTEATLGLQSANWATQARHYERPLLSALQAHGALNHIKTLKFRAMTLTTTPPPRRRLPSATLSKEASTLLKATAKTMAQPALKAALLRLASRGEGAKTG